VQQGVLHGLFPATELNTLQDWDQPEYAALIKKRGKKWSKEKTIKFSSLYDLPGTGLPGARFISVHSCGEETQESQEGRAGDQGL
jgi:hypothetical protein